MNKSMIDIIYKHMHNKYVLEYQPFDFPGYPPPAQLRKLIHSMIWNAFKGCLFQIVHFHTYEPRIEPLIFKT